MKEYLQYIRKLIWSSVKPSARKWFWVIVVAAALAFLVLFGILRYKMKFSVADSGYIGWLFTARAVIIALISSAIIILAVLFMVGTAIYKRDKILAAEQAKEAESAVAGKNDGELPAINAKMLEPYFTALGLEPPKDKNRNKYTIDTRNDRDAALKNKYEPMS